MLSLTVGGGPYYGSEGGGGGGGGYLTGGSPFGSGTGSPGGAEKVRDSRRLLLDMRLIISNSALLCRTPYGQ